MAILLTESKIEEAKQDDSTVLKDVICVKAVENSVKLNKLSSALFCINDVKNSIEIVHFIGNNSWIGIGHTIDKNNEIKYFVFKEEMIYLMECGCCELLIEYKMKQNETIQTCIGLNNTFTLFFSSQNDLSFNFNIYSVFKKLKSMNYIIKRTDIINNNKNKWHNYLLSIQTELSLHFELIYYWIWKRGNNQWWYSMQQGFQSNSIKSVAVSLKKLYQKKPDALILIKKRNVINEDINVNFIHSIIEHIDHIPIMVANAHQNDVLLFQFDINPLLN
eukprot:45382_1